LLRVLHLTDPHLFAEPTGALRGMITQASLEAVLWHYQAQDWRADLVVVTGDLIQDDSADAYAHFRRLLGELALPVYCLPGNHDIPQLMRTALSEPPFFYCLSVERDNWLIVCLDSSVRGTAGGHISAAELARFDRLSRDSGAENVLACLHHPPVALGSKWLDSVGLENSDEVLQRFAATGRVRAVIAGHVHQVYDADHGGIRILATPSTCRQFAPGRDEFAVSDDPPAYRRFELRPDGSFDHELIWVNEAQPS
jgi:Icc protein